MGKGSGTPTVATRKKLASGGVTPLRELSSKPVTRSASKLNPKNGTAFKNIPLARKDDEDDEDYVPDFEEESVDDEEGKHEDSASNVCLSQEQRSAHVLSEIKRLTSSGKKEKLTIKAALQSKTGTPFKDIAISRKDDNTDEDYVPGEEEESLSDEDEEKSGEQKATNLSLTQEQRAARVRSELKKKITLSGRKRVVKNALFREIPISRGDDVNDEDYVQKAVVEESSDDEDVAVKVASISLTQEQRAARVQSEIKQMGSAIKRMLANTKKNKMKGVPFKSLPIAKDVCFYFFF